MNKKIPFLIFCILGALLLCSSCFGEGEVFKITAYCSCVKCCGKYSDGITASGYKAKEGYCAVNWLPFKTELEIEGLGTFKVMDRGAKSLFGDKNNRIKHIDIYMNSHQKALNFGVKWLRVKIGEK